MYWCNESLNITNIFINFFINIGYSLACNSKESTFKYEENITSISFNCLFNENIKESDVREIINKFKDNTAVDFDCNSGKILKLVIDRQTV